MKFLYIAPEHVSGGFDLYRKGHLRRGNECRYVTFFPNHFGFNEDICLDLHWMPGSTWVRKLKASTHLGDQASLNLKGIPPFWNPSGRIEEILFGLRDFLNSPKIERMILQHNLNNFDIYHFEQGADPYRDGRWASRLAASGKGIVCFYHGTDVRSRGIFREVHKVSRLNLTSEIDLLGKIPGMKYLYLPIDTEALKPNPRKADGRIRISHAARNRANKGSDRIEEVVGTIASRNSDIEWVMIENLPHAEAITIKAHSDIFIDQITDSGGWGYGASSVESLALGVPTITRINPEVKAFLGDHPFVHADSESLEKTLTELIADEARRMELGYEGRQWVKQRHGLESVMDVLYSYYRDAGLI